MITLCDLFEFHGALVESRVLCEMKRQNKEDVTEVKVKIKNFEVTFKNMLDKYEYQRSIKL